eukprot:928004-Pelagomonas_calceolata.AAC.1
MLGRHDESGQRSKAWRLLDLTNPLFSNTYNMQTVFLLLPPPPPPPGPFYIILSWSQARALTASFHKHHEPVEQREAVGCGG